MVTAHTLEFGASKILGGVSARLETLQMTHLERWSIYQCGLIMAVSGGLGEAGK